MLDMTNTTVPMVKSALSRKATLVAVNISEWSARKYDKKATEAARARFNASDDAGRFNKLLIDTERLKEINSIISQARALHHRFTKPWGDDGGAVDGKRVSKPRILPNALYAEFAAEFRVLKREFEKAVDAFVQGYPSFVEARRADLQGMFDPADYPDDIRSKFNIALAILPFPDVADFRSDLDPDVEADIREEIAAQLNNASAGVTKESAKSIVETVGHMAKKLKEYKSTPGTKTHFWDSLVENVRDMATLLPAFNLTNDPDLARITDRIVKELCVEDADVLRKNDLARAIVQKSADEIVAEVEKFFA
jgi:hypothetical protein